MEVIVIYKIVGMFFSFDYFFFKKERKVLEKIPCFSRIFLITVTLCELFPAIQNFELGIFITQNSYYVVHINIYI